MGDLDGQLDLGLRLGAKPAPMGRRVLAFVCDLIVLLVASLPIWFVADAWIRALDRLFSGESGASEALEGSMVQLVVGFTAITVIVTAQLVVQGIRGVTVGKAVLGLRLVSSDNLLAPGSGNSLLRSATVWIPGVVLPFIGAVPFLISPRFDPAALGRGWHDRVAGSWLIDARVGLDTLDREALRAAKRDLFRAEERAPVAVPSLASGPMPLDRTLTNVARSTAGVMSIHATDSVWGQQDGTAAADTRPIAVVTADEVISDAPKEWAFVLDDGVRYPLPPRALVGREPASVGGLDDHALISISDPATKMSRTHIAVSVEDGRAWIADLDSANGTRMTSPSGDQTTLEPHERYAVMPGAQIHIGGRVLRFEKVSGQ